MRKFILTMPLRNKMDPFGMLDKSIEKELKLFCGSLENLRETLRALTPRGYRVQSSSWFSKLLKSYPKIELSNPLFHTKVCEIKEVQQKPTISSTIEFTNSWGVKIRLFAIGVKTNGETKLASPTVANIVFGPAAKMLKKQPIEFEILKN